MRLVVLGLDGMNFDLIKKYSEVMPNLIKIKKEGTSGILKSTDPPVTAPAWVSFQTGKNIGNHGIINFFKYDDKFNLSLTRGTDLKEKSFYEYLSESGKNVFLLNLPYTLPPKADVDIVGCWLDYAKTIKGLIHPKDLIKKIPSIKHYSTYPDEAKGDLNYLKSLEGLLDSKIKIMKEIISEGEYDFSFCLLSCTDWLQHKIFIDLINKKINMKTRVGKKILRKLDKFIGWVRKNLAEDQALLIMSDHGFKEYWGKFFVNSWLKNNDYLKLSKEGQKVDGWYDDKNKQRSINLSWLIRIMKKNKVLLSFGEKMYKIISNIIPFKIQKQAGIDIERSIAFFPSKNEGNIHLNKKINKKKKEKIKKEIITKLNRLSDIKAYDTNNKFKGKYSLSGDIFISSDKYELDEFIGDNNFLRMKRGWHSKDGVVYFVGKNIKKETIEARIIDLAPTILNMLGVEVPKDMDGNVIITSK